jgi:hypothetical protein
LLLHCVLTWSRSVAVGCFLLLHSAAMSSQPSSTARLTQEIKGRVLPKYLEGLGSAHVGACAVSCAPQGWGVSYACCTVTPPSSPHTQKVQCYTTLGGGGRDRVDSSCLRQCSWRGGPLPVVGGACAHPPPSTYINAVSVACCLVLW